MAKSKLFYSKTFIKDLLIIAALCQTDHEAPKTARQILKEVERSWSEIFPNEPLNKSSKKNFVTATISRHVRDMNRSGLYKIEVHEDNKRGYYNARKLFNTAEAAAVTAMIYQTTSLSAAEKQKFFDKIKSATDIDGQSIVYGFGRQLKLDGEPTKNFSQCLCKIQIICRSIVEGKKISFCLRPNSASQNRTYRIAEPLAVVVKGGEFFLTAKGDDSPTPIDFKLRLMSELEICRDEFQSDKNFSLARHMSKERDCGEPIELMISFPESFIESVVERFGCGKVKSLAPNGNIFDGERQFRATILVKENECLYRWLRCHCDRVKTNFPNRIRQTLKKQLAMMISRL